MVNTSRLNGGLLLRIACVASLAMPAFPYPTLAADQVLYCVVEQAVGFNGSDEVWKPYHTDGSNGARYTISFRDDYSQVTGVGGTDTPFICQATFPNKAADILTCVNSRVASMVFSYSSENKHFVLSMVSPGGWLGVGTAREQGREPLTDHLILGKCQEF